MKSNSDKQNASIVTDLLELRGIEVKLLTKALRDLVFEARISGGVAGPNKGLMQACKQAEDLLLRLFNQKPPAYFIGTENGIEDLDGENPIWIEDKSEHISDVSARVIKSLQTPPSDN